MRFSQPRCSSPAKLISPWKRPVQRRPRASCRDSQSHCARQSANGIQRHRHRRSVRRAHVDLEHRKFPLHWHSRGRELDWSQLDLYKLSIRLLGNAQLSQLGGEKWRLHQEVHSLEKLSEINTIVFDKTGTLTQEQPHIAQIHTLTNFDAEQILTLRSYRRSSQPTPLPGPF